MLDERFKLSEKGSQIIDLESDDKIILMADIVKKMNDLNQAKMLLIKENRELKSKIMSLKNKINHLENIIYELKEEG